MSVASQANSSLCRCHVSLQPMPRPYDGRHIVFELFDTDLNHMIRSETRYDMTHRRWVLYQVRFPPVCVGLSRNS